MYVIDSVVFMKIICKKVSHIECMAILLFLSGGSLELYHCYNHILWKVWYIVLVGGGDICCMLQKWVIILWGYDLMGVWVVRYILGYIRLYMTYILRIYLGIYLIVVITTIWIVILYRIMTIVIVWKTTLFPLLSDERLGG